MVPSADLAKIIARHAKLVGDITNLHVVAINNRLMIVSANKSGIIVSSRIKFEGKDFETCIDGNVLAGILKGQGPVNIELLDNRLNLKSGRLRADIPTSSIERPVIPRYADGKTIEISDKDATKLRDAIASVSIREGGPDAQLSMACNGETMLLSYYDNYYGAFTSFPFSTKMRFGFMPQDVAIFQNGLADGAASISQIGQQLIIKSSTEQVVLQSTTPSIVKLDVVDEGAEPLAKVDVSALKLTIDAMSVLLKNSKDAIVIEMNVGKGAITLAVSSQIGSMKKRVDAKTSGSAKLLLSYRFLSDIISLCKGDTARLYVYRSEEEGEVTRIQIRSAGVHYVAVTSV